MLSYDLYCIKEQQRLTSLWEKAGMSLAFGAAGSTQQQREQYLFNELRNGYSTHQKLRNQVTSIQAEVTCTTSHLLARSLQTIYDNERII